MSAPFGSPDYNPNTWKLGYQQRQFEASAKEGRSTTITSSLANPPTAMVTAEAVSDTNTP